MTAPRVPYLLNLPDLKDPEHFRRSLSDILTLHATQINHTAFTTGSVGYTTSFVIESDLSLVDATAGSVTAFLPFAVDWRDKVVHVKKLNSNSEKVIVHAQSGETVDQTACVGITIQFTTLQIASNGIGWFIV